MDWSFAQFRNVAGRSWKRIEETEWLVIRQNLEKPSELTHTPHPAFSQFLPKGKGKKTADCCSPKN
ncbi:MAG TPA: hypothetical protein DDZ97_16565 [Deltaproteobacteria bacterium]|nr:hypothetical protein [Deltaproteobacteria bacterium]